MRDAEIRGLTWAQIIFAKGYLAVGQSKTEAGEGRTIPLNPSLLPVLQGVRSLVPREVWRDSPRMVCLPVREPRPSDPTRPITTSRLHGEIVRKNAKVTGRWHDNRHTLITDLAESGAGDQTIMDIAGHVSKRMLKHYSHIRMEAKRRPRIDRRRTVESSESRRGKVGAGTD